MRTKNKILITLILITLTTSLCAAGSTYNPDFNDGGLLLLKAGYVDTGITKDPGMKNDEHEPTAFTTQSMDNEEKYYIVQFSGPIQGTWKQEVISQGASIYNYVPNNAFVFRMNESVKNQVYSLEFVKWIGEYKPSYKYIPELVDQENVQISGSGSESKNTYHLLLFSSAERENVIDAIIALDGDVLSGSGNILKVQIPASRLPDVASIDDVSWIEEYLQPEILNDVAADIITVHTVRNNYGLKGNGQIVAVCDTGLDTGVNDSTMHKDFGGRIKTIIDYSNDGAGDDDGHGTHVTGSVLGSGWRSNGLYVGMAPEARLVFQAVGDKNGNLVGITKNNLNDILQDAYTQGARIHTNSWGNISSRGSYDAFSLTVDAFMWEHPDMLIVCAAGNNGQLGNTTIVSPGTAKNALTVGASENYRPSYTISDNINEIAYFSSRGPTEDNRIKPDLVAPGTRILSTKSSLTTGNFNEYYTYMSGTSMATPIVAGTAALVRQYYIDIEGLPNPSAALIKATLINGAYDMSYAPSGTAFSGWPDEFQGWGRVDLENSIFPQNSLAVKYNDSVRLNNISDSWNVTYNVKYTTQPLRITLLWTDYPGNISVVKQLVNDLDLIVVGPSGKRDFGNGEEADRVNNVESVWIPNPEVGTYKIYVNVSNIPQGPQDFSLVVSFKEDNEITIKGVNEDELVLNHSTDINISSRKYSDIWYNTDNGANSTAVRAYHLNTTLDLTDGSHNITVFAREMGGETISTTVNFTVFASQPVIASPASGTIYYLLPDNSFNISGTAGIATNVSVYVNGVITNSYNPVSNGVFNINNILLLNGTNTVNVTSILNYSEKKYFSPNTTIYLSVGEIFLTYGTDEATLPVPGIGSVPYPTLNFNITGTSANPGGLAAAVVRGQDPCSGSSFAGPAIDIRVMNGSEPVNSYQFERNVSLRIGYDSAFEGDAGKLTIAWYDPDKGIWVPFRSVVNSSTHTLTTNITHLSIYAPLEDNTAPVISGLSSSSTTTSVTLTWQNSPDTDYVEIRRNGVPLTTISGSTLTDSGLPEGTTHIYSLRATDFVDNSGEWYNISVTTGQTALAVSGGGGGGGGSSGESAENILFKDVLSVNTMKDMVTEFEFDNGMNDIQYIRYLSLKNSGKISTTIEVLKSTSGFATSAAPDITYRNINIWVGKTGYATEGNIKDPVIGLRVSREWVLNNAIDPYTIRLNRYYGGSWEELVTEQTGSDDSYLYFEAKTPGFSPFSITGKQFALATQGGEPDALLQEMEANTVSLVLGEKYDSAGIGMYVLPGAVLGLSGITLTAYYLFRRRQQN
ncbi:MAG: S8 family serine peptidase [Methanolobus sp.]|uniref:S8 family serine peptidase n=1 Tax=Methanolobus sp. TaxID=1874737 RepID=UPI002730DCD4|nr:S8 family serine peptidase [Methanolobus sp.]MDP2217703.1 S8 family serine peptidase [Methanolobus sp.]